jgi:hypothetical protein
VVLMMRARRVYAPPYWLVRCLVWFRLAVCAASIAVWWVGQRLPLRVSVPQVRQG